MTTIETLLLLLGLLVRLMVLIIIEASTKLMAVVGVSCVSIIAALVIWFYLYPWLKKQKKSKG